MGEYFNLERWDSWVREYIFYDFRKKDDLNKLTERKSVYISFKGFSRSNTFFPGIVTAAVVLSYYLFSAEGTIGAPLEDEVTL